MNVLEDKFKKEIIKGAFCEICKPVKILLPLNINNYVLFLFEENE